MSPNRRGRASLGRSGRFGELRKRRNINYPRVPRPTKNGTFLRSCPKRLIPTRAERNDGPKKQVFLHARLIPERISDKRSAERPETAAPDNRRKDSRRETERKQLRTASIPVFPSKAKEQERISTHSQDPVLHIQGSPSAGRKRNPAFRTVRPERRVPSNSE